MKKTIIIIALLCFSLGTTLRAQDSVVFAKAAPTFHVVEFGLRFMPTFSSVTMESNSGGTITGKGTLGFGVGGLLAFNFSKHIGFEAEILYSSISQKYVDEGMDRVMKVSYVNIPLLLELSTSKGSPINLKAELGPEIGINVGSSIKASNDTLTTVLSTKQTGVGLAFGVGLGFLLNSEGTIRLDVGYRGIYGTKVKSNAGYVGITFLF